MAESRVAFEPFPCISGVRGILRGMSNYHAIVARADGAKPNQRFTLQAESIDQARELFAAKFGEKSVRKVWQDYFESLPPRYPE